MSHHQENAPFFAFPFLQRAEQLQKMKRLDQVIDRINRMQGSETIVLCAQQYARNAGTGKADVFAIAIKHDYRSPNPATRWSDIIRLNGEKKTHPRGGETSNPSLQCVCPRLRAVPSGVSSAGRGFGGS